MNKETKKRITRILKSCEMIVMIAWLTTDAISIAKKIDVRHQYKKDIENGFSKETIYNLIYSSDKLNEQEKSILYNEELLENIIPYYQMSDAEFDIYRRFYNLDIVDMDDSHKDISEIMGYYRNDNRIHIRDYNDEKITSEVEIIANHERIHILQMNDRYRMILEGSAVIIQKEFDCPGDYKYDVEEGFTKALMEIIGPEPIWRYNFEKNSTALEEAIRPYLIDEDYQLFLEIISMNREDFNKNTERLAILYENLYINKFESLIYSDEEIWGIIFGDQSRIYFNEEKMNQVYSKETLEIPLNIIDENHPLYKLRPIDSIDELKKEEYVCIDELGNYYAKKFVTSDEYFSGIEDTEYRYVTIEEYLTEQNRISKCGELEEYHLENGYLVYTVVEKSSNIFEKFPEQSISKSSEYTLTREINKA